MASVPMFNTFSPENVTFSPVYKNKLGGKAIYMNTSAGKIQLQLPPSRAPFGLSSFEDQATKRVSYTLPLSLDDPEMQRVFHELDEKIIKYVSEHSKEIMGQQYTPDVLRVLYSPLVRPSSDDKYAPQLKLKVITDRDGDFVTKCYDHTRTQVDLDTVEKGSTIHTIVDLSNIWVVDKKFGVSAKVEQVMRTNSTKLKECAFSVPDEIDVPEDD